MIIVQCYTNIDKFKLVNWPRSFQVLPNKGDSVAAKTGEVLKVVDITHMETIVIVELHK